MCIRDRNRVVKDVCDKQATGKQINGYTCESSKQAGKEDWLSRIESSFDFLIAGGLLRTHNLFRTRLRLGRNVPARLHLFWAKCFISVWTRLYMLYLAEQQRAQVKK